MAKIYLRGQKTVTVSKRIAQQAFNFKKDENILPNELFQCDDFLAEKRDIQSVVINDSEDNSQEASGERKEENEKYYQQIQQDHEDEIRRRCAMRPEDKAKDTRLAELACFHPITQEFREKIIAKQREYFAKHPRHPYAAITFKELIPEMKGSEYHISDLMPSFALNKVHDIMQTGLSTANHLKLI